MIAKLLRAAHLRMLYRFASLARRRYARLCETVLDQPVLLLSFDCDNVEDIDALDRIAEFLGEMKIVATFAVPGEIIQSARGQFARLSELGHEFMSHGYRSHSEIQSGRYTSTLFYHKLSDAEIAEDIHGGNEIIAELTGRKPTGFRIPHFGHSSAPAELARVYDVLISGDLKYSSSTLPRCGILNGPIYRTEEGLWELPVSGMYTNPFSVLDTYSFGFNQKIVRTPAEFLENVTGLLDAFSRRPVCLNLYCDPSQAVQMDEWFQAIRRIVQSGYRTMRFDEFVVQYADKHPRRP